MSAKSFSGYLKENEKKYHIHYSTNIPSDNGKNARGFQGIHTQIRIESYRCYRWDTDKKEFSKEKYKRISLEKSRDYRFLKSKEDTLIRVNFQFVLSGGSVMDVKVARIRADKKGGYAHKLNGKTEQWLDYVIRKQPSAIESEIHPSHKLRLYSVYFALRGWCRSRQ